MHNTGNDNQNISESTTLFYGMVKNKKKVCPNMYHKYTSQIAAILRYRG